LPHFFARLSAEHATATITNFTADVYTRESIDYALLEELQIFFPANQQGLKNKRLFTVLVPRSLQGFVIMPAVTQHEQV
jgi:hypothetical protein